ncbi:MAG: diadenylate cyclase CdaA [Ignavibacteriaceae bacterium]|jgi:diadenylate cyclase|nr:MAG: TIGR00159 family protein [Chlorobiota bacterium]KXK05740.1 MAG: DNA integrity scanning protein DisA [Chlorobi bacterium OLB4]MBV6398428.1 Cyclic di-AMP synthase CdaA [Ignavibacteria bacterium]MCC6885980.1 TIGR00159 family protein [Ignavibacteriales bacterium]MCE7952770.1 TIGR00159 family protein [Chlorobi bacterium CHB7]MDL1886880.1 TIGR00159 family protein [Ignavibacteria bacterium CHB1]MEB2330210.1 diadenylate cyclase CdaA [Ignavibacteriaceae bacterium]OQY77911.1 MAG: TIGR00159 fam
MDLFKISFLTFSLADLIDILIVSYIFYKLYTIMRGTIASQIFIALLLIIGFSIIAQLLNLEALGWLLGRLTDIWVIAFIILFQPEIRRLLLIIGKSRFSRLFTKWDVNENVTEIVEAAVELQAKGWGALFVIIRTTGLQNIAETGELLQSKINKELLISIFNPKSPLHDGAVLINNDKIEAARCLLPLSENQEMINRRLGTRHRAGVGVTEISDAVVVIISEETRSISLAIDGKLYQCKDTDDLKSRLKNEMAKINEAKTIFSNFGGENVDRQKDKN